jgi:cytochrome oxidase Cu insertion factor (SCO1/SenC/PrrC family)
MRLRIGAVTLVGLLALASPGLGSAPQEDTGLEIGVKAPEFTLKDQSGEERSLGDFLVKGKVALVFYRSADW